jgi:glycosyltransferase involved in cell wall biosynthesis
MRVCIVYDCLFPFTVGGAERWYRNLAERLGRDGHDVTYITLRQWPREAPPQIAKVRVVAVGPRLPLYNADGQRRLGPPIVFGLGVLWHLLRRGRSYDVVHTASFPYFSVLAAGVARAAHRFRLVVDWHELWSRAYWLDYLGPGLGWVGLAVQQLCLRVPQQAVCFARLTAGRLRAAGLRGEITLLEGEYAGPLEAARPRPAEPLALFAGRHIPEKRAPAVVDAIALARRSIPDLKGRILGDGPQRGEVIAAIARHGLQDAVDAPGFVPSEELQADLARALCLVHPSSREGYGLVVIEASAAGTPSILARGEDNAATELIEEGVNGLVAPTASAEDLAEAIVRIHRQGQAFRVSTADWFARNARRLSMSSSLDQITRIYGDG